jgi:hypothetical protein
MLQEHAQRLAGMSGVGRLVGERGWTHLGGPPRSIGLGGEARRAQGQ